MGLALDDVGLAYSWLDLHAILTTADLGGPLHRAMYPETWHWHDPRVHVIADIFDAVLATMTAPGKKHQRHTRGTKDQQNVIGTAHDWDTVTKFMEGR